MSDDRIKKNISHIPLTGVRAHLLTLLLLCQAALSSCWLHPPIHSALAERAHDVCRSGPCRSTLLSSKKRHVLGCAAQKRSSSRISQTRMGESAASGNAVQRRTFLAAFALSAMLGPALPASAVSFSTRGLVNAIRLKEGVRYLLLYRLTGKDVDGQRSVLRDTRLCRLECLTSILQCSALVDDSEDPPRLLPNAQNAQVSASKIVEFLSKVGVEGPDGMGWWD
eukprot:235006-Hanusia_phi.AAC.1